MKKTNINSKKGFTIIEVVLVLAIAGLIFLMVFLALPNLQRTQRDTQRRNDLDRLSTSLAQYITNNSKLPSGTIAATAVSETDLGNIQGTNAWKNFAQNYLLADGADNFEDPNGDPYKIEAFECGTSCSSSSLDSFNDAAVMVIAKGAQCGEEVDVATFEAASGSRRYAVATRLESNGIYCVDNN